ncbi:hypothetical protein Pla144_45580 [Bythopirellula polymerisocia]|uniref:Polysaccharide lyase 14 domain-containing protein n=2 Tax=Bythopirellula polymerisocia TaxID=2528003 RepID=A0A5C6CAT8_9BACT|nr:hypothetical protein Pla144_45580 [Bythopirellula polymerisocia]
MYLNTVMNLARQRGLMGFRILAAVFLLILSSAQPISAKADPDQILGIAARYPADRGIAADEDVVVAFDFEGDQWTDDLEVHAPSDAISLVEANTDIASFKPLNGRAISMEVKSGDFYGGSLEYFFAKHNEGIEPEAIYFRYYLRFGEDWDGLGGKLPGFGGTYNRAGWGGKPSNGYNGWSARGSFGRIKNDKVPIGTYCYHADMTSQYGSAWHWDLGNRGLLEKNRWYCIEQFLHLNSPDASNGIIRAWVDGKIAFEKTDIKFRKTDKLRIEKAWFNVYHGGKTRATSEDHLFIDNIVIARRYIGPLQPD